MKQTLSAVTLSIALAAGVAAPVWAQSREERQMMADIRILQIQAQEMQNLVTAMNQSVSEALKAVNAGLSEQTDVTRKAFADQNSVIDALSSDLRIVREKIDDSNVRVGSLAQEVDSLRQLVAEMNARWPAALEADPLGGTAQPDALHPPSPPTLSRGAAPGASPERMWNAAMSDYWSGDYNLAVIGFSSYLTSFPKSDRADDAQVYVGNSYFSDGKYDKAVEAYNTAIRTYPNGDTLPDAYYRMGVSLRNLRQSDLARQSFEQVIKAYPNSASATLAEQRLQELQ